jgi:hypothetical protein
MLFHPRRLEQASPNPMSEGKIIGEMLFILSYVREGQDASSLKGVAPRRRPPTDG